MTDSENVSSATGNRQENLGEYPWRDEEIMRELYVEKQLSITQTAEELGCGATTVRDWLENHGIETRSISEGQQIIHGTDSHVSYQTHVRGHEMWRGSYKDETFDVYVHRLLAVAEWGFDAVADNDVHHKNGIPWDNRPENLEVMRHGAHSVHHHTKVSGIGRVRLVELWRNGDASARKVAEEADHDITFFPILHARDDFEELADETDDWRELKS